MHPGCIVALVVSASLPPSFYHRPRHHRRNHRCLHVQWLTLGADDGIPRKDLCISRQICLRSALVASRTAKTSIPPGQWMMVGSPHSPGKEITSIRDMLHI